MELFMVQLLKNMAKGLGNAYYRRQHYLSLTCMISIIDYKQIMQSYIKEEYWTKVNRSQLYLATLYVK